jgi:PTS system mannose-specific IIB component/fructoselysine and glucoselysine-specific PTS system IIB component
MAILLYRVDERLIHGQVVVGWGNELHPDRIIVVDDELAVSDWEQELYSLGLPEHIDVRFVPVAEATVRLAEWEADASRSILLTRQVETMRRLGETGGLRGREINIGGLHYAPGRDAVLPYVFLSRQERDALERLTREAGAIASARDLPGARRISAERLLKAGENGA